MAGSELTQEEADLLFKMEKYCYDDSPYEFPALGGYLRIPLKSKDSYENFMLDVSRGRIELQTYNTTRITQMSFKREMDELIEKYSSWLKDKTILKTIDDQWIEITTPYLDRHNDCLQIYAKKDENGFLLTDDGYILNDLLNSGCDLKSTKRQEFLKKTISGFGVQLDGDQLVIHTSKDNFPLKKHNIIQAMLAVNDLFYLATSHTLE